MRRQQYFIKGMRLTAIMSEAAVGSRWSMDHPLGYNDCRSYCYYDQGKR